MKNLKRPSYRHTRQRQIILEELQSVDTHPTADELFLRVRERLPRVSLATVYRNLERLADEGLVQRLERVGQQRRYDGCTEPHTHVRCLSCGAVADIRLTPPLLPLEEVQPHTDYRLVAQSVEFLGYCPLCQVDLQDEKASNGA